MFFVLLMAYLVSGHAAARLEWTKPRSPRYPLVWPLVTFDGPHAGVRVFWTAVAVFMPVLVFARACVLRQVVCIQGGFVARTRAFLEAEVHIPAALFQ